MMDLSLCCDCVTRAQGHAGNTNVDVPCLPSSKLCPQLKSVFMESQELVDFSL